ncbi:hypothetical protein LEP1GSC061_3720 [Leptospira wolffii serovar Khorat str. Khorat-H2]|nr:hypothetical protein LEP1GSC061_3720 [Leptospira wolffii serovar Khorat str. Khorat-H2]
MNEEYGNGHLRIEAVILAEFSLESRSFPAKAVQRIMWELRQNRIRLSV